MKGHQVTVISRDKKVNKLIKRKHILEDSISDYEDYFNMPKNAFGFHVSGAADMSTAFAKGLDEVRLKHTVKKLDKHMAKIGMDTKPEKNN
ncbi:MAG: hypothetical protein FWD32_00240 [Firmicutes bacterium]|nr:hypothetical protein [Bacillota bacterium]